MFRTTSLIVAAASAALAGAGLLAQPRPAGASDNNGGITMSSRHTAQDPQAAGSAGRATASARASASASASSSSGGERGECRARSESSAQARSGDQVVSDHDRDEQVARNGACSAKAESRAQARTGPPD